MTDEQIITIDNQGRTALRRFALHRGLLLAKHYSVTCNRAGVLTLTPVVLPEESWVPCVEHEDRYEISDQGHLRRINPHQLIRIRSTAANPRDGAAMVRLAVDPDYPGAHGMPNGRNGAHNFYVWRSLGPLVLRSFGVEPPCEDAVATARNGNYRDCRLENLYWNQPHKFGRR